MTRGALLAKVVELEGALRKSSSNVKTVDLIEALGSGDFKHFLKAHYGLLWWW